jgi:hypothetical protein
MPIAPAKAKRILVLYDPFATSTTTVKDYLDAFRRFSGHEILYAVGSSNACWEVPWNLDAFDVIVVHYSIRLAYDWHISPGFAKALAAYSGLKVLFIQDEYDHTERARQWIEQFAIRVVFTCVPHDQVEKVYPRARFLNVQFVSVLTGYVPLDLERIERLACPDSERRVLIGYRGRVLPFWYGNLAREKWKIGEGMKQLCAEYGISEDIAWREEDRIYGDDWYRFLGSCVATLGTESGANVFDDEGSIRAAVKGELQRKPDTSYEEIWDKYLAADEGRVVMNQISPRVFESIALRTALILFEGKYSDIVRPDVHYIPLKKDFSNVSEVFEKVRSREFIGTLTRRAYDDVILSGMYAYRRLVSHFDSIVSQVGTTSDSRQLYLVATGVVPRFASYADEADREAVYRGACSFAGDTILPNLYWRAVPTAVVLPRPRTEHELGAPQSQPGVEHPLVADLLSRRVAQGAVTQENLPGPRGSSATGQDAAGPSDWLGPFGDASVLGEVWPLRLTSSLRFDQGRELERALDYGATDTFASACPGQPIPHCFEISFSTALVTKLELIWESELNRADRFSIECRFRRNRVHHAEVSGGAGGRSDVEIPWRMANSIRVLVTHYPGEPRLMLRQVRVLAWYYAPDRAQDKFGLLRRTWLALPASARIVLRPVARKAKSLLR